LQRHVLEAAHRQGNDPQDLEVLRQALLVLVLGPGLLDLLVVVLQLLQDSLFPLPEWLFQVAAGLPLARVLPQALEVFAYLLVTELRLAGRVGLLLLVGRLGLLEHVEEGARAVDSGHANLPAMGQVLLDRRPVLADHAVLHALKRTWPFGWCRDGS